MLSFALNNSWDLYADSTGAIATLSGAPATAQDVACAIATYLGELYYDTTQGIPWLTQVLSQTYSPALLASLLQTAALSVPNVVSAKVSGLNFARRVVHGTVNIIDVTGAALGVSF